MRQEFDYFRWPAAIRPAAAIATALIGLGWLLGAPAAAQEEASPSNVIVDYGVLDRLGGGSGGEMVLPAPATKPVSRIVAPGSSGFSPSAPTPPDFVPAGTSLAVPTSPLETATLGDVPLPAPNGAADLPGELSAGGVAGVSLPPAPTPPQATATTSTQSAAIEPGATTNAPSDARDSASAPLAGPLRIPYEPDARAFPDSEKGKIDGLIERLHADPGLRLQVLAYAAGDEDETTRARGLSLARALTLRRYLAEQGIPMHRMDVRALGNSAQEEPADRVDLIPVPQ